MQERKRGKKRTVVAIKEKKVAEESGVVGWNVKFRERDRESSHEEKAKGAGEESGEWMVVWKKKVAERDGQIKWSVFRNV